MFQEEEKVQLSLSYVGADSQKTHQGGLRHFTAIGGQMGWQVPARSRG